MRIEGNSSSVARTSRAWTPARLVSASVPFGNAVGEGDEDVGGAIDHLFARLMTDRADEQLGGLFRAIAQVGASEFPRGKVGR